MSDKGATPGMLNIMNPLETIYIIIGENLYIIKVINFSCQIILTLCSTQVCVVKLKKKKVFFCK